MKLSHICNERLESFTSLDALFRFITKTYDGYYLLLLSISYFFWAVYMLVVPLHEHDSYWPVIAAYPMLLFVIYVRQRLGTCASDKKPMWFSFVSLTAIAIVPVYIIFWR